MTGDPDTLAARPALTAAPFRFERDTFAFANELIWQYRFDPVSGAMTISNNDPPPTYSHRCFVVVRSARQFFYHARFEPGLPVAMPETYKRLVRRVLSRNPRQPSSESDRVVIPGYASLRAFSSAHESLLKAQCGGPWRSYFLRSHWRMVFPVPRRHQERTARRLHQAVGQGLAPLVHLFRFPRISINHGILLFESSETEQAVQFVGYDPNTPAQAVELSYDRRLREFRFPPARYWAGGPLKVVQIYCGLLY